MITELMGNVRKIFYIQEALHTYAHPPIYTRDNAKDRGYIRSTRTGHYSCIPFNN